MTGEYLYQIEAFCVSVKLALELNLLNSNYHCSDDKDLDKLKYADYCLLLTETREISSQINQAKEECRAFLNNTWEEYCKNKLRQPPLPSTTIHESIEVSLKCRSGLICDVTDDYNIFLKKYLEMYKSFREYEINSIGEGNYCLTYDTNAETIEGKIEEAQKIFEKEDAFALKVSKSLPQFQHNIRLAYRIARKKGNVNLILKLLEL